MQTNEVIPITKEEIVPVAQEMRGEGRALTLIHGYRDKEGAAVVSYEYDFGPLVKSYEIRGEEKLPTISHIYDQAAAWPEREINELIGVEFEGLDCSQRLFVPDNMLSGKGQILVTPIAEMKKKNGLE